MALNTTTPTFDPAINTLLFDIIILYYRTYITLSSASLGPSSSSSLLKIAERAVAARIASELPSLFSPQITDLWSDPSDDSIMITTSFTGLRQPITLVLAIAARQRLDYLGSKTGLATKFVDAIWKEGDEQWSLEQCQLWLVCAGDKYTVRDALYGRDFGEWVDYWRLMTGHLIREGYISLQDEIAIEEDVFRTVMQKLDPEVRFIIEGEIDLTRGNKLQMLKQIVEMPFVKRRFENLKHSLQVVAGNEMADGGMETWRRMIETESLVNGGASLRESEGFDRMRFDRIAGTIPEWIRQKFGEEDSDSNSDSDSSSTLGYASTHFDFSDYEDDSDATAEDAMAELRRMRS